MPVMDGLEATIAIRADEGIAAHHQPFIIALTANAMQGDRDRCKAAGMNLFLTKPITLPPLTAALRHAFNAALRRRATHQAEIFSVGMYDAHHRLESSPSTYGDGGAFSASAPSSPEGGHGRSLSQPGGFSVLQGESEGSVLFPSVAPIIEMGAQGAMGRVASAPTESTGTMAAQVAESPHKTTESVSAAQLSAALSSSSMGPMASSVASMMATASSGKPPGSAKSPLPSHP